MKRQAAKGHKVRSGTRDNSRGGKDTEMDKRLRSEGGGYRELVRRGITGDRRKRERLDRSNLKLPSYFETIKEKLPGGKQPCGGRGGVVNL